MMMKAFWVLLIALLVLTRESAFAQQTIAEKMLEDQDDSSEQSELLEQILELREKPLDLNAAGADALELLPEITPQLSSNIIRYREQNGPYRTKRELLRVTGINESILSEIIDFVRVKAPSRRKVHSRFEWRTRVTERLDKPLGFQNGTYQSSSQKVYNRAKFSLADRVEGGLLLEKDPGEARFDDLRLFYASFAPNRNIAFTVGNYQFQAGQGLVLWSPYGFSKSSDPILPLRKKARGQRGYLTVDENAAFFGAALRGRLKGIDLTAFFSTHKLDATPASEVSVTGLFATGLHRTETEKTKRDQLKETILGGRIAVRDVWGIGLGVTAYRANFDKNIQQADPERNRFKFSGESNNLIGIDWSYAARDIDLFGEVARSKNGGRALVAGTRVRLNAIRLAFLYRNYARDFQNLHAFGFGEKNGTTQNEIGTYTGMNYRISSSTNLSAYYDIFKFPWRSFFQPLPVDGHDFLAQLEHKINKRLLLTLRFREKTREEAESLVSDTGRDLSRLVERRQQQWRLQLDLRVSGSIAFRSRFQTVRNRFNGFSTDASDSNEDGFLFYQDINLQPSRSLRIRSRLTFFNTDSFDSGVFQYENDLPGVVTNRALFGRGERWYLLLGYQPFKLFSLSIKYSATRRNDTDVIGSGPERLQGNLDRRLALQLETQL